MSSMLKNHQMMQVNKRRCLLRGIASKLPQKAVSDLVNDCKSNLMQMRDKNIDKRPRKKTTGSILKVISLKAGIALGHSSHSQCKRDKEICTQEDMRAFLFLNKLHPWV